MASISPGKGPLEGCHGAGKLLIRFALDDIQDRFGLCQVDPAVEEGPFGELSRPGEPGPMADHEGQYFSLAGEPAVRINLRHVLAGIGAGPSHEHREDLVHVGARLRVDDDAEGESVALEGRRWGFLV